MSKELLDKRLDDFAQWRDSMIQKTGNPFRHSTARLFTAIVGGASAVIGLTVLVGWYTGTESLARLYLGSEPMSYNVAAAFLFSGAGLLMQTVRRRTLVFLFGAVTIVFGLIALVGLAFGLNLGIDWLLYEPFISEKVSQVAGMTTMTAVAFLLIGISLVYHGSVERSVEYPVSAGTLASLVIACGLAGFVAYLMSIETSFQSYMPVHTALGILLVGIGLLNISWWGAVSEKTRMPRWAPITVGLAASAVAFTLFHGLVDSNRERTRNVIAAELASLQTEVQVRLQLQINAIKRLSARWEVRRRTPRREWEADASFYVSDHPGYEVIAWMDASHNVRWIVPSSELESVPDEILHLAEPVSTSIYDAKLSRQVTVTPPFEISPDHGGYVLSSPLFPAGEFDGYFLVTIQFDSFFESILAERTNKGYGIVIVGNRGEIYSIRAVSRRYERKWAAYAPIRLNDVELYRLRIWPTPQIMETVLTPLLGITLSVGLLMALLLTLVTHFVQKSMRRRAELEISHQQLRKESTNRKQIEERFHIFIENAPEAFVILDPELRIRFVNSRTEELFGDSRENLIGESIQILFPERFQDSYLVRFANFDEGTKIQHLGADQDMYAVRSDDQEFPVEIGLSMVNVNDEDWVLLSIADITERKRSFERILHLFESAPNAMIAVDSEGLIHLVNAQTEAHFGYTRDELVGAPVEQLMAARFRERHPNFFADFFRNPESRQMGAGRDLYAVRKDGHEFPIEIGLSYMDMNGEKWALAAIVDITVRKQAEKVLQRAHDELETMVEQRTEELNEKNEELERSAEELTRSNAELEQFAYVASHDLQEPLRSVAGYTQLLAKRYRGKLDADADEFIAYAVDGANRMRVLINELLAYSRVGTKSKPPSPTNVETVVSHALANLDAAISESGAIITRDPLPEVMGDEVQLTTLFQNLIANAIKFQDQMTPEIHIGAENQVKDCLFSVRDNGIGIEPEHAERVFLIFHRLHGRNEYEGTGMGLATCKKIVERHGGRIWIESEPGKGSIFYFTIPIRQRGD